MKKLLQLHPDDNVGVAVAAVSAGEEVMVGHLVVRVSTDISPGHKVALDKISKDDKVRRNNMAIGSASQEICTGDHVHLHNLKSDYSATLHRHYPNRDLLS